MSKLITYVADMTSQRDRDMLEISVADVLFRLLNAERLNLWRVAEDRAGLRGRLLAGLQRGESISMSDPTMDVRDWPLVADMPGVEHCCSTGMPVRLEPESGCAYRHYFPLSNERQVIGVLEVEHMDPLDGQQEQLIDGMLRIYRNHLALLDYSEHDTLTGLLNRKTFDDLYARRVSNQTLADNPERRITLVGRRRVSRPGETTWLAVIDIDFFKKINDRFGHVFGDEVLLLVARLMRTTFRANDTLFRFGGEEFVVLLAATDAAGARSAFERFRGEIEKFRFPQVGEVTVSIGYCRASKADTATRTFERADAALYYAKQHGRNQVRCFEELLKDGELTEKQENASELELF